MIEANIKYIIYMPDDEFDRFIDESEVCKLIHNRVVEKCAKMIAEMGDEERVEDYIRGLKR